jgi:putative transposase
MNTVAPPNPYIHHRFAAEIISHGGWLYFRFCLSYRDVEELLLARGVISSRPLSIAGRWCTDSKPGGRSRVRQEPHKR